MMLRRAVVSTESMTSIVLNAPLRQLSIKEKVFVVTVMLIPSTRN
jgi:hypothetical protein